MFFFSFNGHKNNEYKIDSCLISTDDYVISGSEDGKIYIWNLIEGKLAFTLDNSIASAAFSRKPFHSLSSHPTKPCLLAANMDKIYLWKTKCDSDDEID
uniref:WD repeat domain-containing protein 83 n=1 Tax=Romanomermis culicivorax TaxID=13658 RepID=A0A915IM71_ROMCU